MSFSSVSILSCRLFIDQGSLVENSRQTIAWADLHYILSRSENGFEAIF